MRNARTLLIATELFADGGIQHLARDAVRALGDNNAPLEVWTLRDHAVPAGAVAPRVRVRCAGGSRPRLIGWALAAGCRSWRDCSVVVMHAHLAPLAVPLQMRGAFLTVMLNGVEVWKRLSIAEREGLLRADRLVAISAWSAARFREANPEFADARIEICHLGLPAIASDSRDAGDVDAATALIVSRLSREDQYKGHEALLRAWPAVRARVPDARLVIVGDGDDRQRLEALARALGISDAASFEGHVDALALRRWYRRCAFFVLPSSGEGFGLVYLEAMREGKACLACAGAAEEVIAAGQTGLILPDQQVDRLAGAIVRLFTDVPLTARLGENGRIRWRERFTDAHFAARFRTLVRGRVERAA
jgi:phosphatidylinositol alpha-1,6-mannosyltransferase